MITDIICMQLHTMLSTRALSISYSFICAVHGNVPWSFLPLSALLTTNSDSSRSKKTPHVVAELASMEAMWWLQEHGCVHTTSCVCGVSASWLMEQCQAYNADHNLQCDQPFQPAWSSLQVWTEVSFPEDAHSSYVYSLNSLGWDKQSGR